MKNIIITLFLACTSFTFSHAQLADGTVAPNFTGTDINGVSHNLYTLLDQGKTVYLDFSATWCIICWNYHNTHAMKDLWNTYGPPGTNEAYVLFIESYQPSNTNCLYGPTGCNNSTKGDWVTGTPYPIIDDASIGDLYDVPYYPIVYVICPADKKLYQTGTQNVAGLWNARAQNCATGLQITSSSIQNPACFGTSSGAIDITHSGGAAPFSYNWSNGATTQDLTNIPAGTYTCTITAGNGATSSTSPQVVNNPPAALSLVQTASTIVGCNGVAATITVNATGGWAGNYTYNWNNGQSGATATGLNPGTYTVTATDNMGCSKTLVNSVAPPVTPTAMVAAPSSLTCTQNVVTLNGAGSSSGAGFTYLWTATNGGIITGSTSTLTTTVSAAGMYTLRVTNTSTACSSTAAVSVTNNTTPPVVAAAAPGALNCTVSQLQLSSTGSSQGNNFTYQWSTTNGNIVSGQSSFSPVVNQPGTYRLIITNSANGCTASATATVVQHAPVTATIAAPANISCNGGTNGSATVNPGGGNGVFNYQWSNGSSTAAITGLPAGMYMVTVTDTEFCTATATVNLTQPNTLVVNASATGQSAVGINNGSAVAAPAGGTSGYGYTWSNGATTSAITSLAPGSYTVTITDANSCTAVQAVVVNVYNCAVSAQPAVTNVTCANLSNGTAAVSLSGGTAPFNYVWSNGASSQSVSGLAAGAYLVTVTDGAGCTTLVTANITQPPVIVPNAMSTSQTAVGLNNGTAMVMPSGGTPGYTYQWSNGGNTAFINNLAPGTYTATITDVLGCTAVQPVVVNPYNCAIAASVNAMNVSCANGSNGVVSISMSGGAAPFDYQWSNGATSAAVMNLPAGNYVVTISDAAGCTTLATALITQPTALSTNASATPQTAIGQNNGTATANPGGGAPGYTYFWSNGATTALVTDLAPGSFTVTVTDANGCTAAQTVVVNPLNCNLLVQVNVQNADCSVLNNGAVSVAVSAGNPPFVYLWNTGATTSALIGQTPGTYFVTVSDNTGCQVITPVTIGIADLVPPQITCPGNIRVCPNSNMVTFSAPVGTDNCGLAGSQMVQVSGLPSGSFFPLGTTTQTFRLTDAGGNSSTCSFEIVVSSPVIFENISVVPSTNNQSNGSIDISISGGTAPYFFIWTNTAGQLVGTTEDITNLPAGFYSVKVTDLFGCTFFYAAEVKSVTNNTEPDWISGLSILPNPANELVNIVFETLPPGDIQISVADMSGRVLSSRMITAPATAIDCSGLPAGMYGMIIRTSGGVGYRKLVISPKK